MPYVEKVRRTLLDYGDMPRDKGELNYVLTQLMVQYVEDHGTSYQTISDAIGAATDAAEEMRRRVLNPYEDLKRGESGDVYPDVRPRTGFIRGMAHGTGGNEIVPDIEGRDL